MDPFKRGLVSLVMHSVGVVDSFIVIPAFRYR